MATYINNNVKFHGFSKSPVSPDTTLGGAVNPSGHTITTSQVRSQDIPAFLNTFQGSKDAALTWLGTNYATPAHNDIVYYGGEFKAGFSTPKCLKYNAKAETPAWEDFDITTAATLKNADDKDVIAVHQNCTTVFVDGGNNAATNSNRWSLFVKKSDGSILDHFVASTDKIVAGMPSLGYNALVLWNGAAIDEGELDANYVGNTFAGIVHLNKQYATGDDAKFKVTCFEYIGEKLDESITSISDSVKDIVNTTMQGVVASVGATTAASAAGISVDSSVTTSPKIDLTTGSITSGETKLVTGGAVKTYVDTTALAEGGSIAQAIKTAKDEAIANAKVTLTAGNGITIPNSGSQDTAFTISVDTNKIATKESVDNLSDAISGVSQTVASIQTELSTGSVAAGISEAKAAAQAAMEEAQKKVASVTGPTTGLVTVTGDKNVTITVSDTIATKSYADTAAAGAVTTGLDTGGNIAQAIATAKSGAEQTAATALNTAKEQSLAQTGTLSGMFTVQTAGTVGTGITGITITDAGLGAAITKAKTDAEATAAANLATARGEITTEIATAVSKITTGEGSLGAKVTALETATGTTLPAAIEQALTDAKAYSDSLHTTSLDYVVLGDNESLPTASADTLGKIYLVKEGNTANGETGIDAISGSYVEYMTRKVSETEYTWEKIGTTAADLNAYAKTADVTSSIATAKSEAIAAAKTETTTQVNALAATHATDKAALEGSIGTINNTIAAMDADLTVNGIRVTQIDGKITGLTEALITASVPAGTTSVEGNVAYVGSAKHVIAPEKFQTAAQMPAATAATLTSWVADLSNLTVGDNMFNGCTKLTVFVGDLSSLTSGVNMFSGCTLDAESLEILAENLPTVTSGTIDIGASTNATDEVKATIKGKGWTLKSNGTEI